MSSRAPQPAYPFDLTLTTSKRAYIPDERWKTILAAGLKKLVINNGLADHAFIFDLFLDVVIANVKLESVDVSGPAPDILYNAIARIPIKRLAVEPYLLYGDPALEWMIRSQDLVELEIRCPSQPCIFKRLSRSDRATCRIRNALLTSCPNLRSISLSCSCWGSYDVGEEMLAIILSIPRPAHIHISATSVAIECIFSRLPQVSKIEFTMVGDRTETTRMMPSRWILVRGVNIKRAQFLDVSTLRAFFHLRKVKLEVMDRAETALATIPLNKVDTLHIGGSPEATTTVGNIYYSLEHDAIFKAVVHAQMLCDVSILHCRIDKAEICAIIRHVGKNLKRFETSMLGQTECPSQRVLDLMNTIMEFSTDIEHFLITDSVHYDLAKQMIFRTEGYERYRVLYARLYHARAMLHNRAKFLDMVPLGKTIKSLYPN